MPRGRGVSGCSSLRCPMKGSGPKVAPESGFSCRAACTIGVDPFRDRASMRQLPRKLPPNWSWQLQAFRKMSLRHPTAISAPRPPEIRAVFWRSISGGVHLILAPTPPNCRKGCFLVGSPSPSNATSRWQTKWSDQERTVESYGCQHTWRGSSKLQIGNG